MVICYSCLLLFLLLFTHSSFLFVFFFSFLFSFLPSLPPFLFSFLRSFFGLMDYDTFDQYVNLQNYRISLQEKSCVKYRLLGLVASFLVGCFCNIQSWVEEIKETPAMLVLVVTPSKLTNLAN